MAFVKSHGKKHPSTAVRMDLAVWDGEILTIPGPRRFGKKDVQRWYDIQWKLLVAMSVWSLQFGSTFFIKSWRPNMIGYIMRRAMTFIYGEKPGEKKWKEVRAFIPVPHESPNYFVWEFDGSLANYGPTTGINRFRYPFECRIDTNGLTIMQPPPNRIVRSIARKISVPSGHASYIRGNAQFLGDLTRAFGSSLTEPMRGNIAGKALQDKLEK